MVPRASVRVVLSDKKYLSRTTIPGIIRRPLITSNAVDGRRTATFTSGIYISCYFVRLLITRRGRRPQSVWKVIKFSQKNESSMTGYSNVKGASGEGFGFWVVLPSSYYRVRFNLQFRHLGCFVPATGKLSSVSCRKLLPSSHLRQALHHCRPLLQQFIGEVACAY